MIGLDVETTGLTPHEGRLSLLQAAAPGRDTLVIDCLAVDSTPFLDTLMGAGEAIVAHNANFEELWLREYGREFHLEDTMIMSHVLYGGTELSKRTRHSLAAVVERELGEELAKDEQTSDWAARPLTPEQIKYAAKDAEILLYLAPILQRKIREAGLERVYQLENRVRPALDAMERRGVAMRRDKLEALIEDYTARAERLRGELAEEWGINPGSSKQLIEHFGLASRKGWPKTDGGSPSTNQEAMKALLAEEESVAKRLEWKEVEKIRSTYGESLRKRLTPEGRIHARFNPFGTATGRFSSSSPNLQKIPKCGEFGKRMRGLFWSGDDSRVLIKADYASIELWVAAVLWDDPHMQRALRQGVNMHVATAASLFNVPASEVTKEQKATGKIVNFALLYGGSPRPILQEFTKNGMPIDEAGAETMHRKFFATPTRASPSARRRRARPTTPRSIWARTTTRRAPRSGGGGTLRLSVWPAPKKNHEMVG